MKQNYFNVLLILSSIGMYGQTAGNVGIKTSTPTNALTVNGNSSIGSGYTTIAAPANGAIIQGNVGVGTSKPVNNLTVSGNTSIGAGYAAIAAPANGAIIQGNVGVGTSKPVNDLTVSGNTSIGAGYAAIAAPANGAIIQGNVGVGTSKPVNDLTVSGNSSIGAGYAAIAAPANGAIIQGNVGVGTSAPAAKLDVIGKIKITDGTQGAGKVLVSDANGVGSWRDTSATAIVINSTTGFSADFAGDQLTYLGAKATVTVPGYYIVSTRLISDKTPIGCGAYIAYNLNKSATANISPAFPIQDIHMSAGPNGWDHLYTSNIAYLTAGTYYMRVRDANRCTTNVSRHTVGENSFTLTLLK